jgi:outer membrane lipoprotein-sorting protein
MVYIIIIGVALFSPVIHLASAQQEQPSNAIFEDDPMAHALYDKMVETMRKAESFSYESDYRWEAKGRELGHCKYTIFLKKPNYFRLETVTCQKGIVQKSYALIHPKSKKGGILIGDGDYLWIYWPDGRPRSYNEDWDTYQKTRYAYIKERTPIGKHSIGHKTSLLGAGMSMTIIDPSTFHGYTDSLQPYIDGVRSLDSEKVRDEECDMIEVSFMKHQRSWYLWLSKRDHLPRRLKQVVRASYDIIAHEVWSKVTINAEISTEKFIWKPPEDWKEWRPPSLEEALLKPGREAPNFNLLLTDGSRVKLSDHRGKVVWLYIWRAG